jgi:hypothetical protein
VITINSILSDSLLKKSLANIDPKHEFKVADFCSNQRSIFLNLEYDTFTSKVVDIDSKALNEEVEQIEVRQAIDFSSAKVLDIAVARNNSVLAIDALERTIDGKQFFRDIHIYRKKIIASKENAKMHELQQWRPIHTLPIDSNSSSGKFTNSAIGVNATGTKLYVVYNSTIMVFASSIADGNLCAGGLTREPDITMNTVDFRDGFSAVDISKLLEKAFKR